MCEQKSLFYDELKTSSDIVNKIDDGSWIEGCTDNEPILSEIIDYVQQQGFTPKPETFDKWIDKEQGGVWRWDMDLFFLAS